MPTNATLRNCYRSRKNDGETNMRVPQSFSFFPREGLDSNVSMLHFLICLNASHPQNSTAPICLASYAQRWCWSGNWRAGCHVAFEELVIERTSLRLWRGTWQIVPSYSHHFLCGQNPFWGQLNTFGTVSTPLLKQYNKNWTHLGHRISYSLLTKSSLTFRAWTGQCATAGVW